MSTAPDAPRCGRWRLKPFELARPILLTPDGPLTLGEFLAHPDPAVPERLAKLDPLARQELTLARLAGAPPEGKLALFGQGGYTFGDAQREVAEGTPLGVRIIDAECKLVGLLLAEALGFGQGDEPPTGVELADG